MLNTQSPVIIKCAHNVQREWNFTITRGACCCVLHGLHDKRG